MLWLESAKKVQRGSNFNSLSFIAAVTLVKETGQFCRKLAKQKKIMGATYFFAVAVLLMSLLLASLHDTKVQARAVSDTASGDTASDSEASGEDDMSNVDCNSEMRDKCSTFSPAQNYSLKLSSLEYSPRQEIYGKAIQNMQVLFCTQLVMHAWQLNESRLYWYQVMILPCTILICECILLRQFAA